MNYTQGAKKVISILHEHGFEGYLVGGCVRDNLMGHPSHDEDITTNATPDQVMNLFKKSGYQVIPTGLKHGTISVIVDDELFEITTYREDIGTDGRRPEKVYFASSLSLDLKRRDFTINAMAYDPLTDMIIDEHGGQEDIAHQLIRTVGDASTRFQEDYLRMMRAVRFATKLHFTLDESTKAAIQLHADSINKVSAERIKSELDGILLSDQPSYGIRLLRETGLLKVILPEVDRLFDTPQNTPYHIYDVGEHTMRVLDYIQPTLIRRYAALFHDIGKPDARFTKEGIDHFYGHGTISYDLSLAIMKKLKFSKYDRTSISLLVLHHDDRFGTNYRSMVRYYVKNDLFLDTYYDDLRDLWLADTSGQSRQQYETRVKEVALIDQNYQRLLSRPHTLKELAVNGYDLLSLELGIKNEEIGDLLEKMRLYVLYHPEDNTKERLLSLSPGLLTSLRNEMKNQRKGDQS